MAEKIVEGTGPVREVDGEFQETGGREGGPEEPLLPQSALDLPHPRLPGRGLEKDGAGVDAPAEWTRLIFPCPSVMMAAAFSGEPGSSGTRVMKKNLRSTPHTCPSQ
jgi:hypothetical protein